MRKWEYQITRYQLQGLAKGKQLLKEAFNEEGKIGWGLAQFWYHRGE